MADLQAVLERQTSKVEELQQQAEQSPSVASIQALASIYRSRAETLDSMAEHERALDDRQTAVGLLAQLIVGAGRNDLVEPLVETGEGLRATLRRMGRDDEAFDNALGETQLVAAAGQVARAVAQIKGLANDRKAALAKEATPQRLEQVVKAYSLLAGTLFQAERIEEALHAENEAIDIVSAFQPPQPEFLASLRSNRALTRAALGREAEALAELDEVVASVDGLLAQKTDAVLLAAAVEARTRKAQILLQQRKLDEAIAVLETTTSFAEGQSRDDETAALHRRTLRQLAEAARMAGQYDKALAAAERWTQLIEARANQGQPELAMVEEMLEAGYERALIYQLIGRHDVVLEDANQIAATWDQLAGAAPDRLDLQHRILMALDLRERSLTALGRNEEAVKDQTMIINGFQQLLQAGAPPQLLQGLLGTLQRRAETLQKLGRDREAQADLNVLRQIDEQMRLAAREAAGPEGSGAGPAGGGIIGGGGPTGGGIIGGGGSTGGGIIGGGGGNRGGTSGGGIII
jgi:tetratricopeptide (TPR) repeat protein